jgi:glycosyltransferase involved in cell wall biosynthesis/SAM-dependent methyltransferase
MSADASAEDEAVSASDTPSSGGHRSSIGPRSPSGQSLPSAPLGGSEHPSTNANDETVTSGERLRAEFAPTVVVLTTSYPRRPDDVAGAFVRDAVENLRRAGAEVRVVSPSSFRHFGIAYGHGIAHNLRRYPWRILLLPLFLAGYARAARRAARGADLVHAHWLPSALAARRTGKPYVVQLWGTDVELARRVPWLARHLLRRARLVLTPSEALAHDARLLGAREVRVVPSGVELPVTVGEPNDPPHVLYAGRLSEEKGVRELLQATEGLPRVVVGDGPLRAEVPDAVGFVPPAQLHAYYERAAVVACPSRREGYGVVAREALAHARPVVASSVGGLTDAIEDGVTGLLVPPGDADALRAALERLLDDAELRSRLGEAGRELVRERFSWEAATAATLAAYHDVLAPRARHGPHHDPHHDHPASLVDLLRQHERAWNERPLLRSLYREWFDALARRMSRAPGLSVELGSGIARFREAVPDLLTTDVEPTPWSDRVADATELPFADGEVANLVLIEVFHHVPRPSRFLDEATRVLVPGGRVLVLDPYCSLVSTRLYGRYHHERTDAHAEPVADDASTGVAPLASNEALATLAFFDGADELARRWPELRLVERERLALLAYPLSGGFTRRPLVPDAVGRILQRVERRLGFLAPLLAFRCLVVLEKR